MNSVDLAAEPLPALVADTGPGLLLSHGAGGSPEQNFPFIDDLASCYTVVGPHCRVDSGRLIAAERPESWQRTIEEFLNSIARTLFGGGS